MQGRLLRAPEGFLDASAVGRAESGARAGRRSFMRRAFAAAAAGAAMPAAIAQANALLLDAVAADGDPNILELPEHSRGLGRAVATEGYGRPSKYEANLQRRPSPGLTQTAQASVSFCPLQGLFGIVTPNGLHLERHHQGWWDIDPAKHRLMVNGSDAKMLRRAMVFTMDELMRLPSVSRFHFIECGANTGMEWGKVVMPTVQYMHGMLSCCEFTGVPLITLLEMCGADLARGRFLLAEGADGSSLTRTIPMDLVRAGEVLVAYGQNGEMLRPESGYPLRLVVPGVQGVSWVKWLRRVELGDAPYGSKDETLQYVDLMPDGTRRQYGSLQEVKSVLTTPSGGQVLLDHGFYSLTGRAWSGRGAIRRVDVSVDGGRNWRITQLQPPLLPKCLTRFSLDWVWDGTPALVTSRATDDGGHVQPTYAARRAVRGRRSIYHNNAIQTWLVGANGEVSNVQLD